MQEGKTVIGGVMLHSADTVTSGFRYVIKVLIAYYSA